MSAESLTLELVLAADEARRGGSLPTGVPVFHPCLVCHGSGQDWLFPCLYCEEHGRIEEEAIVRVCIPSHVREGTVVERPLHELGIHDLSLRLYLRMTI